ncbi:MAG: alpha/beta fold hydrolase [Rhizobiaceae bacterium]
MLDKARGNPGAEGRNRDAAGNDRSVRFREITIPTPDGFPLAGTLFEGDGGAPLVLISGATAAPRQLYAAFAIAAVEAGARAALIYDYRGVGGSKRPDGWRRRIDYKDWALVDMPAAMAALDGVAPGHAMVGVGQSFGGQALGLCGAAGRFERYGMVATMTGYHRLLDDRTAWARMNLVGVPVSLLSRDIPRWLGVGEPMPSSCFRDWARWCRHPDYFFGDPGLPETARFATVTTPILAVGLTDDPWGNPRAVGAFMKHYENAPVEVRWLSTEDADGKPIGHLGYFRSRFAKTLWPQFIAWLLKGEPMTMGAAG